MGCFICSKCDKHRDCDYDECYSDEKGGLVCGVCYQEIEGEKDESEASAEGMAEGQEAEA